MTGTRQGNHVRRDDDDLGALNLEADRWKLIVPWAPHLGEQVMKDVGRASRVRHRE